MPWKSFVRYATYYLLDSVVCLLPTRNDSDLILLIRLDNIGDFVLWLDSAERISRHYRQAGKRVILLASNVWAAWAQELNVFDQVISLDRSRLRTDLLFRFRMQAALRRLGCETAILASYSHDWYAGDTIVRTSGSRVRIGSIGDPKFGTPMERWFSHRWFTKLIPASSVPMMELDRNAEFTSALLETSGPARLADLSPSVSRQTVLQEFGISGHFYVLFPGASEAIKRWPAENFASIAERMYRQTGWLGVICGNGDDALLASAICAPAGPLLLNLAGRTSLSQLTAILSAADLLVSNDTAAVHIAAALRVRTVCALGGGHFGRFLPYAPDAEEFPILPVSVIHPMDCFHCDWKCIYPLRPGDPAPCIAQISVDKVWLQVRNLLVTGETPSMDDYADKSLNHFANAQGASA